MDFDGIKKYVRSISPKYYLKDYVNGSLESTSKWKSKADYSNILSEAMNNVKSKNSDWSHIAQTWVFSDNDISSVK
ncbi:hypothetical protein [Clostridium tertium]|uniref:hypothetical protein n=1 Tax=Clostridium tertium TaxID=1559 RepID=UPI0024B3A499|nr:hypothetical protein [Clostridium tertium]MDI9215603.1 hypothetical protein [Clostridium tertium]